MATRSVHVEFHCEKETLKFQHDVPETLLANLTRDSSYTSPEWMSEIRNVINPFVVHHHATILNTSLPICSFCGAPTTSVIAIPTSLLNRASDLFVWSRSTEHVASPPAWTRPDKTLKPSTLENEASIT